jgi:cardiolipin synthase
MDRLILAPDQRRTAVLQLLRSAQRTLILSMFRCDDMSIVDELAAAVRRGVHVRILITQRARGWREKLKELTALLKSLGAEVLPYQHSVVKYHAKYIVADEGPALVTSLNFTRKCFEKTCDFLVFSDDPSVVSGLKTLFESDCSVPAARLPQITDRLIVGPEESRSRLTQALADATSRIQIIDHRVSDPQIIGLLMQKRHEGVAVQVIGSPTIGGLICHGRIILTDQKTAIIGSTHFSYPSLDFRREVAIVTKESNVVAEMSDYFENLAAQEQNLTNLWDAPPASPEDEDDEEDE